MTMIYRINAGAIPSDNWIQDLEIGGGRVIGEVCHFIDYLTYLCGSLPTKKFQAAALPDANQLNDTLNILIQFENGSSGVVAYYSNGSKSMTKEYIEVFSVGLSAALNDFKELKIYGKGGTKIKLFNQNKGQKEIVGSFINGLLSDGSSAIPFKDIVAVTKTSFKVLESIKRGGEQVEL